MPKNRINFSDDFVLKNERVGINTADPQALLDVGGDAKVSGNTYIGGNVGIGTTNATSTLTVNGDLNLLVGSAYTTVLQVVTPTANRTISLPDATGTVALVAGSTNQVTYNLSGVQTGSPNFTFNETTGLSVLNAPVLAGTSSSTGTASQPLQVTGGAYVSGNLGVGSTNPQFTLDVNGNVNFNGNLTQFGQPYVASRWTAGIGSNIYRLNGNVGIATTLPIQPFQVGAAGTNVVVVDNIGEIGIGTTNPTQKLDVVGNVRVSGLTTTQSLYVAQSATFAGVTTTTGDFYVGGDLYVQDDLVFDSFSANNFSIAGVATARSFVASAASFSQLLVSGISTFSAGPVLIGSGTSTGTSAQRLQVTGGAYVSGNLGIGTTNPSSALTVNGDLNLLVGSAYTTVLQVVTPTANRTISLPDATGTVALVAGSTNQVTYNLSGVQTGSPNFTYNDSTGLSVGSGTSIVVVDTLGDLGIGTTNPTSKLSVSVGSSSRAVDIGTDLLVSGSGAFTPRVTVGSTVGAASTQKMQISAVSRDNGLLEIENYGGNQLFSVSNNDTEDALSVYRYADYTGLSIRRFENRKLFGVNSLGIVTTYGGIRAGTSYTIADSNASNELFGRVNVRSPFSTSTQFVSIVPKFSDRGALSFEAPVGTAQTDRGTQIFSISNNLDSSIFRVNDLNRNPIFEASRSGNVGIGTTLPLAKLEVNGNLRVTSAGSTAAEQLDFRYYRNVAFPIGVGTTATNNRGALSLESNNSLILAQGRTYAIPQIAFVNDDPDNIFSVAGIEATRFASNSRRPSIDVTGIGSVGIGTTRPRKDLEIRSPSIASGDLQIQRSLSFSQLTYPDAVPGISSYIKAEPHNIGVNSNAPSRGAVAFDGWYDGSRDGGQLFTVVNDNTSLFAVNRFVGMRSDRTARTGTRNVETVFNVTTAGVVELPSVTSIASTANASSTQVITLRNEIRGGIDTTSPVRGSAVFGGELEQTNNDGGQLLTILNDNSDLFTINTLVGLSSLTLAPTGTRNIRNILNIRASGNIGIGTTNPQTGFEISTSTQFRGTVAFSQTSNPNTSSVMDIIPVTSGIVTYAPSGGGLVITENRNNAGINGGQIYTLENNDNTLFRVNTVGFGLTTLSSGRSGTTPIYPILDINNTNDIRIFDTEVRKILSIGSNVGPSTILPGDGDLFRIDSYQTPFIGSFPTVSKAVRIDKFGLIEVNRSINQISGITTVGLGSTSSPSINSTMSFELTNNTTLTVRVRGTDGVIRTGTITLS